MDRALVALGLLVLVAFAAAAYRSRSPAAPERIDPAGVGLEGTGVGVLAFSGPYCHACRLWREELERAGLEFRQIDIKEQPEMAARHGVETVPLVLALDLADGRVIESFHGAPEPGQVERLAGVLA